jgi:hypothetical protein
MAVTHRKRLRRLDETACTLGVFFNIHCDVPRPAAPPGRDQQKWVPVLRPIAPSF